MAVGPIVAEGLNNVWPECTDYPGHLSNKGSEVNLLQFTVAVIEGLDVLDLYAEPYDRVNTWIGWGAITHNSTKYARLLVAQAA